MTIQYGAGIPLFTVDDGTVLLFNADIDGNARALGVLHLTVSASQPDSSNPAVTWTLSSDPGTWIETLKYSSRTQTPVDFVWDDATVITYNSPALPGPTGVFKLLGVTG
jgi:hypothetical protein